jgi:hypothetical protein
VNEPGGPTKDIVTDIIIIVSPPQEFSEQPVFPPGLLNPVWLYVPANLKIPKTHLDVENEICYWLHTILVGQYSRKHDLENTTRINRQTIRQILHPTKETKARRWLLAKKIIFTDHSFVPGERSKAYGLNPMYEGKVIRWQVSNPTIAAKILHHRLQRHDLKGTDLARSSVLAYLEQWANKIQINADKCFSDNDLHLLTVEQIANGDIDFVQDQYGRVHTPFTRLYSPFRDHLCFQGERLVNTDIRNSQVVFFLQLLMTHITNPSTHPISDQLPSIRNSSSSIPTNPPPPSPLCCTNNLGLDLMRFKALVEAGTIYDYLLELAQREIPEYIHNKLKLQKQKEEWQKKWKTYAAGVQPKTAEEWRKERRRFQSNHRVKSMPVAKAKVERPQFKQVFFTDVFFGRNLVKTPLTELFQREFPSVAQFIRQQKQADYRTLAQNMQRAESRFVIEIVCRRLMEHHPEIPVITIHDSIMTTQRHAATVKRIMGEEFQRMGIRATVRTDGEG